MRFIIEPLHEVNNFFINLFICNLIGQSTTGMVELELYTLIAYKASAWVQVMTRENIRMRQKFTSTD